MSDELGFLDEGVMEESKTIIEEMRAMADRLVEMEFNYTTLQEKANQAKKLYDEFRCVTVPTAFRMAGITSLETTGGARINIRRKYYCSPNKNEEDQKSMCDWLREHNGGDLIKSKAVVDSTQIPKLLEAGIPHTQQTEVNTTSLKAWLKREVGEGSVATIKLEEIPPYMHFIQMDEAEMHL